MSDSAAGLRAARLMGPYFAVESRIDGPGWRPLAELADDPRLLAERVAATRTALAGSAHVTPEDIEERAAASIMQLGMASRLLSPALASVVLTGSVPDLAPERIWWQPGTGNPVPLAIPRPRGKVAGSLAEIAEAMTSLVVDGAVRLLVDVTAELVSVSRKILWGNVASGLGGAAAVIAASRPALAERARQVVTEVLASEPLLGAGEYTGGARFRRHSCCLFYRVPRAGLCGDCVLAKHEW